MVDGEIRAGAIPPWCTAAQGSTDLEPMDLGTECVQRIGRMLGRLRGET